MAKTIDNTSCHCLKMRRSASNVIAFYDGKLKSTGITVRQYSLLYEIGRHEGCSVRTLSEATELDRSTLARSLKPLLSSGYIEDRKSEGERNSKLYLTETGKLISKKAAKCWEEAQKEFEKIVGDDRVKVLEDILSIMETL